MKARVLEYGHQAFHGLRTLTFLGEYRLLHGVTSLFRPWVTPAGERPPEAIAQRDFLLKDIQALYRQDAELFAHRGVPLSVLRPESPLAHGKRLTRIMWEGLKMARQRKLNQTEVGVPLAEESDLPEYFLRNFHWQIGGYLTEGSGEIYDHQVEILFTGTAQAMRRLVLFPILDFARRHPERTSILEIAAGTAPLTSTLRATLPAHRLTVTDLSSAYLKVAERRLADPALSFQQCKAEALPFPDASQDLVFSVFLFHELPAEVRQAAIKEMKRVLRPGGLLVIADSIQENDVPEYQWALERFPQDYHEPFYRGYTRWPLREALAAHGFSELQEKRGFFTKCVWGTKAD